jgi:hypothetical protein
MIIFQMQNYDLILRAIGLNSDLILIFDFVS